VSDEIILGNAYNAGYRIGRVEALEEEADWLEKSHRNSDGKGYSSELRRGYELAARWVRSHADRARADVEEGK
jgi:hypothetical protein